jgi:sec-independent protein translocase protein TatB
MFDIGASEIFVIGVVALIVIGPERLPRVAKTLGHLFGRLQRYVSEVKSDISREIELEELRNLKNTMQDAARSIEQSVTSQVNYIDNEVKQAGAEVQKQVESVQKQAESIVEPVAGIQLIPPTAPAPQATSSEELQQPVDGMRDTELKPGEKSTNEKPG